MLRRLREDCGKTVQAVGDAKVAGATKVWRIETGKTLPSISDVLGLCWLYGADQATTQRLTDMVVELSQSNGGWWEEYGERVPSWLSLFIGMEQAADRILIYEPEFVYGLLQTPAYALAVNANGDDARKNADLRLARQKAVFTRNDDFQLLVIHGQGALTREVGGPKVLAEQIVKLKSLEEDPRVNIRVLTWEVGMHDATSGPFSVFEFADEEPVVYVPLLRGGRYIEKEQQVSAYHKVFDSVWTQAQPMKEFRP
jgi:hypothetical protein